jgi:hypothetical protein
MSRKVIIKALLPHRDTISTMTVSPRYCGRNFTFPAGEIACCRSQISVKRPLFAALCPICMHQGRARDFVKSLNAPLLPRLLAAAFFLETPRIKIAADAYVRLLSA